MKDLNKINAFVRVAEHGSFTKAARDLRMTASAISKHVNELETKLGFSLLNRSTHGVKLTEVGQSFFTECVQILGRLDHAVTNARNLQREPHGTLRINADPAYASWVLGPLLPSFIEAHPQLRIELNTDVAADGAVEAGFDLVIAMKRPPDPGLTFRDLGVIEHVVCAAPDYWRRCGMPHHPRDLANHNCLVSTSFAPKEWPFKIDGRTIVVRVGGGFSSNDPAVLAALAEGGSGVARLPRYAVQRALAAGALQTVFDGLVVSREPMHAYFSATEFLPAKTQLVIDFLLAALKAPQRAA
jgi:DNA-binding transcriptional LysR family regulator